MSRIFGLDPGLRCTGWGVINALDNRMVFVGSGTITTASNDTLAARLHLIHIGLAKVLTEYMPNEVAIEQTVVNRNPSSSLKLGHARGVAILAAAIAGLPVWEYSAKSVKQAVTGTGNADKVQVTSMVSRLLPQCGNQSPDASDALAVAICHAGRRQFDQALSNRQNCRIET